MGCEKPASDRIRQSFVTGYDFSHAESAARNGWALQAAEKLIATAIPYGFVSGHDFGHADKDHQINVGL
jgi:hypothetical protein